jgi:hypothetical protein
VPREFQLDKICINYFPKPVLGAIDLELIEELPKLQELSNVRGNDYV